MIMKNIKMNQKVKKKKEKKVQKLPDTSDFGKTKYHFEGVF